MSGKIVVEVVRTETLTTFFVVSRRAGVGAFCGETEGGREISSDGDVEEGARALCGFSPELHLVPGKILRGCQND